MKPKPIPLDRCALPDCERQTHQADGLCNIHNRMITAMLIEDREAWITAKHGDPT